MTYDDARQAIDDATRDLQYLTLDRPVSEGQLRGWLSPILAALEVILAEHGAAYPVGPTAREIIAAVEEIERMSHGDS